MLIEKAVNLWSDTLLTPKFDHGETSIGGEVAAMLGALNIKKTLDRENEDELKAKIESFKSALIKLINEKLEQSFGSYISMSTDYSPNELLSIAADEAGISHSLFSVKSSVSIMEGMVTSSFGYGATATHHYPMPDGRWLITSLRGSDEDISKLIHHAMNGNEMNLLIE